MAGLHGWDAGDGPLFRHEPSEREVEVARELLKAVDDDGARLLGEVAAAVRYVKCKFPACARFAGAVDHLRTHFGKLGKKAKRQAQEARHAARKAQDDRLALRRADEAQRAAERFRRLPVPERQACLDRFLGANESAGTLQRLWLRDHYRGPPGAAAICPAVEAWVVEFWLEGSKPP